MSPKSKDQFDQIKDERREQILHHALQIFSRKGLAATKIGDIAAAAGLSHGLVYHYFQSKDEIFTELVRRAMESSSSALLQLETLPMEPLDKIRAITRAVLDSIDSTDDSAYYFFLMVQAMISDANPPDALQYITGMTIPTEVMMRVVQAGQAAGQLRAGDPYDMDTMYWSAVQGLAVNKIAAADRYRMPQSDILVRIFE